MPTAHSGLDHLFRMIAPYQPWKYGLSRNDRFLPRPASLPLGTGMIPYFQGW